MRELFLTVLALVLPSTNIAAAETSMCFDGSYEYSIRGRLIDEASALPVCCAFVDFRAVTSDASKKFSPARVRTDTEGGFEVTLRMKGIQWGSCDQGSTPPPAPALRYVSLRVEDAVEWLEVHTASRTSTTHLVELGAIRVPSHPDRKCKPYCLLPEEKLRNDESNNAPQLTRGARG